MICNLAANDNKQHKQTSVIDIRTLDVVKSIARDIGSSGTGFD